MEDSLILFLVFRSKSFVGSNTIARFKNTTSAKNASSCKSETANAKSSVDSTSI